MKKFIVYTVCLTFFFSVAIVFAELTSLVKEYTYQASELDSKISCRAIALEQVKRELLEELGNYVQSSTVVKDYQIEKDEIKTLTGGVVQTKILDEKWDGKEYWIRARISADRDEVAASIDKIKKDDQLAQELAESNAEKEDALKEMARLQEELMQANADKAKQKQYNLAVNQLQAGNSFEEGTALTVAGDYTGAAKAYDRVIYLVPNDAKAYFNRSVVYINLGNYNRATYDINRAMLLNPANTKTYYRRAVVYKNTREARIANMPHPPQQQISSQPNRWERPKDDPLQRFLDRKQVQHNLVRVNPRERRSFVKEDNRQYNLQLQSNQKEEWRITNRQMNQDKQQERKIERAQTEKNRGLNKPVRYVSLRKELNIEEKKKLQQKNKKQEEEKAKHHQRVE
jgi:tetratricopeptide (TPR) repeat protein